MTSQGNRVAPEPTNLNVRSPKVKDPRHDPDSAREYRSVSILPEIHDRDGLSTDACDESCSSPIIPEDSNVGRALSRARPLFETVVEASQLIIKSVYYEMFFLVLVLVAGVAAGVDVNTSGDSVAVKALNLTIVLCFTVHVTLKFLAVRCHIKNFFYDKQSRTFNWWSIFDVWVVTLSFAVRNVALLQLARLLRIFQGIEGLKMLLLGVARSLSGIVYVLLLLFIIYYACALIGYEIFAPVSEMYFGTLKSSFISLWQLSLGDPWQIIYPTIYVCESGESYPNCQTQIDDFGIALFFYVCFLILTSMVMLNLLIGVMTSSIEEVRLETESVPSDTGKSPQTNDTKPKLFMSRLKEKIEKMNDMLASTIQVDSAEESELALAEADLEAEQQKYGLLLDEAERTVQAAEKIRDLLLTIKATCLEHTSVPAHLRRKASTPTNQAGAKYLHYRFSLFCMRLCTSNAFQAYGVLLTLVAAVMAGAPTEDLSSAWGLCDLIVTCLLLVEWSIRLGACGTKWWSFFVIRIKPLKVDIWNILDMVVIVASFISSFASSLRSFKLFKLLRLLRLFRFRALQDLSKGLLNSLVSLSYVLVMMVILFYVYAVAGVSMFKDNDPLFYKDLGTAFLSLFSSITGGWMPIFRTNYHGCDRVAEVGYPAELCTNPSPSKYAIPYFLTFNLISALVILNLIIGIITTSMQDVTRTRVLAKKELQEAQAIEAEIGESLMDNLMIETTNADVADDVDDTSRPLACLKEKDESGGDGSGGGHGDHQSSDPMPGDSEALEDGRVMPVRRSSRASTMLDLVDHSALREALVRMQDELNEVTLQHLTRGRLMVRRQLLQSQDELNMLTEESKRLMSGGLAAAKWVTSKVSTTGEGGIRTVSNLRTAAGKSVRNLRGTMKPNNDTSDTSAGAPGP
eukprot:Rmarinus@m.8096